MKKLIAFSYLSCFRKTFRKRFEYAKVSPPAKDSYRFIVKNPKQWPSKLIFKSVKKKNSLAKYDLVSFPVEQF